jgi:hypothetical protein
VEPGQFITSFDLACLPCFPGWETSFGGSICHLFASSFSCRNLLPGTPTPLARILAVDSKLELMTCFGSWTMWSLPDRLLRKGIIFNQVCWGLVHWGFGKKAFRIVSVHAQCLLGIPIWEFQIAGKKNY